MDPSFTGHRPRLQIIQGDADQTISFKNSAEAIKQWTNVLGLSTAPTSTDMTTTSIATYSRQFWKNSCGYVVFETWAGKGGSHSMGYEEDAILKFFGLDVAGGADPEPECPAGGGGSGGGGAGGASGAGASGSGSGGKGGSGGTDIFGVAGSISAGGSSGSAAGGGGGSGGSGVAGATSGIAGSVASGGTPLSGGTSGAPGSLSTAGSPSTPGSNHDDPGGCSFVAGQSKSKLGFGALALGLALVGFGRRRRSARR
jgi:hypothetical protein